MSLLLSLVLLHYHYFKNYTLFLIFLSSNKICYWQHVRRDASDFICIFPFSFKLPRIFKNFFCNDLRLLFNSNICILCTILKLGWFTQNCMTYHVNICKNNFRIKWFSHILIFLWMFKKVEAQWNIKIKYPFYECLIYTFTVTNELKF